MPVVDKTYCASSFLMYRSVLDREKAFSRHFPVSWTGMPEDRVPVADGRALVSALRETIARATAGKKCALALSGGIDSAILLALMPPDTIAYTFECVAGGVQSSGESEGAARYLDAHSRDVEHKIVPITWQDMEELSVPLMQRQGSPIHSIEVQIYKAARQALADGCDVFVFGETADCLYGGHSMMLARDWTFGEFVDRFSFVRPYHALRDWAMDVAPFAPYEREGSIDVARFLAQFEAPVSCNFYANACGLAGIEFLAPYAHTFLDGTLDLDRVRAGENKYVVREAFAELYPGFEVPPKKPMPRPMAEWLADWPGPSRPEFWPNCTVNMSGDQKWLVWALERFLDVVDETDAADGAAGAGGDAAGDAAGPGGDAADGAGARPQATVS